MIETGLLVLLAIWVSADTTAFGQILVSQPLVAGWLAGWIAGDMAVGLGVGILLQWVWSGILPLGGATFPWAGPAAVAAAAVAVRGGGEVTRVGGVAFPDAWTLALVLVVGLGAGEIGSRVITAIRRRREKGLGVIPRALQEVDARLIRRWNRRCVVEESAAGAAVATGAYVAGALLLELVPLPMGRNGLWVALPVLAVGVATGAPVVVGRRAWVWLVPGLIAAAAWKALV